MDCHIEFRRLVRILSLAFVQGIILCSRKPTLIFASEVNGFTSQIVRNARISASRVIMNICFGFLAFHHRYVRHQLTPGRRCILTFHVVDWVSANRGSKRCYGLCEPGSGTNRSTRNVLVRSWWARWRRELPRSNRGCEYEIEGVDVGMAMSVECWLG